MIIGNGVDTFSPIIIKLEHSQDVEELLAVLNYGKESYLPGFLPRNISNLLQYLRTHMNGSAIVDDPRRIG